MMTKTMIAISTILIMGFFTASAYSYGCGGMYQNGYNNGMYGSYVGEGFNNGSYQSFNNDTQVLRSSIAADRAELNVLIAGANPDVKRARILSRQISASENELRTKAQEHQISRMGMMGYGQGWNCGFPTWKPCEIQIQVLKI